LNVRSDPAGETGKELVREKEGKSLEAEKLPLNKEF
jgi:hypothetical protein